MIPTSKLCVASGVAAMLALAHMLASFAAAEEQLSPLRGQNMPHDSTSDVFVSVYLDRLLDVDSFNYRHTSVLYFYITWNDTRAAEIVRNQTMAVSREEKTCQRPCTNKAIQRGTGCCDGIYMPSFFFRNAFGFSEERPVVYEIYALPPPNSSVLWVSYIHGTYYQAMDFRHFPFDSMDLLVEMDLLDTSPDNRSSMNVHFSSGGVKMYSVGRGDDASEWDVEGISFKADKAINKAAWFNDHSTVDSHPKDPLPLCPSDHGRNPFDGNKDQVLGILIRVRRFWRYHLVYSVLPIILCAYLGFIVFFLDKEELSSRVQVIVTLFLSLTAIQFVVGPRQPYSSYMLPTQQLVLATYVLFSIIAIESIVVFHIAKWTTKQLKQQQRRREAQLRHSNRSRVATRKGTNFDLSLMDSAHQKNVLRASGVYMDSTESGSAVHGHEKAGSPKCPNEFDEIGIMANSDSGKLISGERSTPQARQGSALCESLAADEMFAEYFAYRVDMYTLLFVSVCYNLAVILIFAIQSGYVESVHWQE